MNIATRVFLVLLRLVIGWHFLFEGWEKVQSHLDVPADNMLRKSKKEHPFYWWEKDELQDNDLERRRPVWTSEGYLRGAVGPLAASFRGQAGDDPHAYALERLTLPPTNPGERPKLPPALDKDWQSTFDRFVAFYGVGDAKIVQAEILRAEAVAPLAGFPAAIPWHGLAEVSRIDFNKQPDKVQLILAQIDFEQARTAALDWLRQGEREAVRSFSGVSEKVKEKTPDRIAQYRAKVRQLREVEEHGLQGFKKDVWKKNLTDLRRDVDILRAGLLIDVNRPLKESLEFIYQQRLTPAQQKRLKDEDKVRGRVLPLPEPEPNAQLLRVDRITMYGLTAVGACLILGLFTRTACVAGAGFLLMFYLAMPSLPWLPVNPRAEGHYFFVNKNIIEMIALLALATTYSGRWVGLDGLIHALNPWRSRDEPSRGAPEDRSTVARGPAPVTRDTPAGPSPGGPSLTSPVKEATHGP